MVLQVVATDHCSLPILADFSLVFLFAAVFVATGNMRLHLQVTQVAQVDQFLRGGTSRPVVSRGFAVYPSTVLAGTPGHMPLHEESWTRSTIQRQYLLLCVRRNRRSATKAKKRPPTGYSRCDTMASPDVYHICHMCSMWTCSHLWKEQGASGRPASSGVRWQMAIKLHSAGLRAQKGRRELVPPSWSLILIAWPKVCKRVIYLKFYWVSEARLFP